MNQETPQCEACSRLAVTTHELFPGRGRRKECKEYGIQVRVCNECHQWAHGRGQGLPSPLWGQSQEAIARLFCGLKGWNHDKILLSLNTLHERESILFLEGLNE